MLHAATNSKTALFSVRIPLEDYKALVAAETGDLNYRALAELAIAWAVQDGWVKVEQVKELKRDPRKQRQRRRPKIKEDAA